MTMLRTWLVAVLAVFARPIHVGVAGEGGTLEQHLVAIGALDAALAAFAREAWERARATCERCARRTDLDLRGERRCRCPRAAWQGT